MFIVLEIKTKKFGGHGLIFTLHFVVLFLETIQKSLNWIHRLLSIEVETPHWFSDFTEITLGKMWIFKKTLLHQLLLPTSSGDVGK